MHAGATICPHCHHEVAPGSAYCPNCGEAIDPALVAELQWLYRTLGDLDRRIAAGQGDMTVTALREDYHAQYLAKRTSAGGAYLPGAASAAAPPPAVPATPQGTPFSWSAFFAEQSIAIMAYIGAFLLLIATLIFEIGRWQALGDSVKLAAVVGVYLLFGGLGQWLRRVARLRTVGGAYLVVFALLTPLVALAVYLFALRGQGVSIAGMVCLSACYAVAIYLVLALQTRLAAYSYFAWIALAIATQALLPWIAAPSAWWSFALSATALALLAPRRLKWPAHFAEAATMVAAGASALAALGIELQGFILLPIANVTEPAPAFAASPIAFAAAALALAGLAAAWGQTLRDGQAAAPSAGTLDLVDVATAALGAQAVVALAYLAQFDAAQMVYVLAALALAELGVALVLRQTQSERRTLRYEIEWLAVGLGAVGAVANVGAADPNWPYIVGFVAAGAVAVGAAVVERERWWVVAGGIAVSLAFQSIAAGIVNASFAFVRVPFSEAYRMALSELEFGFTMLLWALALGMGFTATLRRYAAPLYLVALLNAIYVALMLPGLPDAGNYQTLVLTTFAVAALIAGRRENEPISSGFAAGIFGAVAVLPLTLGTNNGLEVALVGLLPALVALGLRRLLGRAWAIAPYAVAGWAIFIAEAQLALGPVSTHSWSVLGISFAALFLLVMAVPATVAALWEDQAWMMILPATLLVIAIATIDDPYARSVLTLALAGGGIALRVRRGRWWDLALLGAATLGALITLARYDALGDQVLTQKIVFLVVLAAAGYTAALVARGSVETGIAAALLIFLPMLLESVTTEPTWTYTTALAAESIVMTGLGVGMRARILQLIGSGMVGLAALRGAVLAYQSGVPIALIVAGMAALLLGGALWLSLRGREVTPAV
jgi:hypothetical protein